ncbi:MAG: dihydropteroate synthase [Saprospiraceae bacterium]
MLDIPLHLNCKGQLLSLETPILMGILNVTPDSFYDGGRYHQVDAALRQAERMITEGASIIDIGGMSSRPGAPIIETEEELRRVLPTIQKIKQHFPEIIISIDTVKAAVAQAAVDAGASMVNDISAGKLDADLYPTVARLGVPYILMHMQGKPASMQDRPEYDDIKQEMLDFFAKEIAALTALGVKDILIDPGFGFGKTLDNNYDLLANLEVFRILRRSILIGVSRKSMIYKFLGIKAEAALNGTSALHLFALQKGAKILRVHDVGAANEVLRLWQQLEQSRL